MRARTLGSLTLGAALLWLVVDVIRNLPEQHVALGPGPEGFPWPTRGLGEITLGMQGGFRLDLEDRLEREDGSSVRVPRMTVAGEDPRPEDEGMSVRQAVITSFGEGSRTGEVQVIVEAPRAWVPMTRDADGTVRLDRDNAWLFREPVVRLPGLAGGQEFVLETDRAELDPLTNEIWCPGAFELTSAGLRFAGSGLRLDPRDESLRFGEDDGRVEWNLALAEGGQVRGFTDGGGSFEAVAPERHVLRLDSVEQCWFELPPESNMPGRLDTDGLVVRLRPQGGEAPQDRSWRPSAIDAPGRTLWSGSTHLLRGGSGAVGWSGDGALLGLLLDGPILARALDTGPGWHTASGGAHVDPRDGRLSLWDRVVARTVEGAVHADRAAVDRDQRVHAEGGLVLRTARGMSFAERLDSLPDAPGLVLEEVVGYPAAAEVDRIDAPRMEVRDGEALTIPTAFTVYGEQDGEAWSFTGERLVTRPEAVGAPQAEARGGVRGRFGAATWSGDTLKLREEHLTLLGAPALLEVPLEDGSTAFGRAERVTAQQGALRLQGKPRFDLPAAALGLGGDRVVIEARRVTRREDGSWLFEHDLRFSGACGGTALRAVWYPDGRFEIDRARDDENFTATLADGAEVEARARTIRGRTDGTARLEGDVEAWHRPAGATLRKHLRGSLAELREDGGFIQGDVVVDDGVFVARAQRATWTMAGSEPGELILTGNARFEHPDGEGRAERVRYDPATSTAELFRGRRPAWVLLRGERQVEADWIEIDLEHRLISSRDGVVRPVEDPR